MPLQAKKEMIAKFQAKVEARRRTQQRHYAAMVESIDEDVGRIVRKLDELKLAANTIIVFTSDNGGLRYEGRSKGPMTSNAPLRAGKGHAYEGGIRVPLIVCGPGVAGPARCATSGVGHRLLPDHHRDGRRARRGNLDGVEHRAAAEGRQS